MDHLRVKTDKCSEIQSAPNATISPPSKIASIKRVTHVGVEAVRIVEGLPNSGLPTD